MSRELLVFGEKTFKISVPDEAKITFGPFSPPSGREPDYRGSGKAIGTLRIYMKTKDNIIAVFTNVRGFRDTSLDYQEEIAKEEGATIWKSDKDGYRREEKVSRKRHWVNPLELEAGEEVDLDE